jgi:hypothetical protein
MGVAASVQSAALVVCTAFRVATANTTRIFISLWRAVVVISRLLKLERANSSPHLPLSAVSTAVYNTTAKANADLD